MSANEKTTAGDPSEKEQKPGDYVHVEGERGIYRYMDQNGNLTYHERPWINEKRTWRALGADFTAQRSLRLAREEYQRRRTQESAGQNPYAEKNKENAVAKSSDSAPPLASATSNPDVEKPVLGNEKLTVSEILIGYRDANFPDKYLRTRQGRTLELESRNVENMLEYFNGEPWDELLPPVWDKYKDWRVVRLSKWQLEQIEKKKKREAELRKQNKGKKKKSKKKQKKEKKELPTKHRTVDQERNTMVNAYRFAIRKGWIDNNRATNLPRFQPSTDVTHCREFCPLNSHELHGIARLLFADRTSEVLGWQMLFEAYTGKRTEEVLMLRTDAKPGEPGYIRADGNMDVFRTKKGANPYVFIHHGLKELIKAHAVWKAIRYPKSPWFFPGREEPNGKAVDSGALRHALRRLRKKIGRKITSHGMRAFYVLIRRSHGILDSCIAWEIGHTSGGLLIAQVYGTVPSSWLNGGGPKLNWLPDGDPAWRAIAPFTSPRFRRAAKT